MPWTTEYFPRARPRLQLPVVLSQEEVLAFFDRIPGPEYRAALMTAYGAGLRVSEVVGMKLADIDSHRMLAISKTNINFVCWISSFRSFPC